MNDNVNLNKHTKPRGSMLFGWLEHRHSVRFIIAILVASCIGLVASDFIYDRYGHFYIEEMPGFFAAYGFIMFSLIILGATLLRFLVGRREDYYGDKAVDSEKKQKSNLEGK